MRGETFVMIGGTWVIQTLAQGRAVNKDAMESAARGLEQRLDDAEIPRLGQVTLILWANAADLLGLSIEVEHGPAFVEYEQDDRGLILGLGVATADLKERLDATLTVGERAELFNVAARPLEAVEINTWAACVDVIEVPLAERKRISDALQAMQLFVPIPSR